MTVYQYAGNNPGMLNDPMGNLLGPALDEQDARLAALAQGGVAASIAHVNQMWGDTEENIQAIYGEMEAYYLSDGGSGGSSGGDSSGGGGGTQNSVSVIDGGAEFKGNQIINGLLHIFDNVYNDYPDVPGSIKLRGVTVRPGDKNSYLAADANIQAQIDAISGWSTNGGSGLSQSGRSGDNGWFGSTVTSVTETPSISNTHGFVGKYILQVSARHFSGVVNEDRKSVLNMNVKQIDGSDFGATMSIDSKHFSAQFGKSDSDIMLGISFFGINMSSGISLNSGFNWEGSYTNSNRQIGGYGISVAPKIGADAAVAASTFPYWWPVLVF